MFMCLFSPGGMRNSILGMASHDLSNKKTTILGATLGAIPGIGGNPHERFSSAPSILGAFFQEFGWSPRASIAGLAESTATTEMTKTTGIQGAFLESQV